MPRHTTPMTTPEEAKACEAHCFGPEGPGGAIKSQVDKWSGAIGLGVWVAGVALALLAVVVTVSIALAPGVIRSSVAQVVPGLVRDVVADELRRAGVVGQGPVVPRGRALVLAPSLLPPVIPQAHAETKGSP